MGAGVAGLRAAIEPAAAALALVVTARTSGFPAKRAEFEKDSLLCRDSGARFE